MSILGLRDSASFVTNERPKNYREGLMLIYRHGGEGKAPLTALTAAMKSRSVDDPEFNWWEKEVSTRRFRATGSVTSGATTINLVSSGDGFRSAFEVKAGDVLWVEHTNEYLRVAADPTDTAKLNVQRGFSGSTPAALNTAAEGVNPNILIIGSVYEEGSLAPTGVARQPFKSHNYTQIFRNTIEMTRTAMNTRLRTGDQVAEAKREALEMMGMDVERALFLGRRWEGIINGKPARTLGGLLSFMDEDNIKTADTTTGTSFSDLENYIKEAFVYGSNEKMAFCGDDALMTIQRIVRRNSSWEIQSGIKEYGMSVSRLFTPFGTLVLKRHPLFTDASGGTTDAVKYYGMSSWMWILDMKGLQYVHLKGGDIAYQSKLQDNGLDGEKSGYLGELSIEVHNPKAFYLVKNLAVSAIDGTGAI